MASGIGLDRVQPWLWIGMGGAQVDCEYHIFQGMNAGLCA